MSDNILKYAAGNNASDIHLTQNKPAWIRINGEFKKMDYTATVDDIDKFVESFLPDMLCRINSLKTEKVTLPLTVHLSLWEGRVRANSLQFAA